MPSDFTNAPLQAPNGDAPPSARLQSLLAYANIEHPGRIIDLGCGVGTDSVYLAKRGWRVTAVDVARVSVLVGRLRARVAGVQVRFERADVTTLTAQGVTGPFDVAYDHACFMNLDAAQADQYAEEVAAAVRPGGALVVLTRDPGLPSFAVGRYFCPASNDAFAVLLPWFEHCVSLGTGHCANPSSWQVLVRRVYE